MITKREMKTTWTLFMVCICYFIFVMPITLVNVVNVQLDEPKLHLALFCIYWLQYSLNFFIYAGRSEQYRKAYSYFIHKVSHFIHKVDTYLHFTLQMRACICDRQENSTTTAALFYVDRNMLPAILKNYAGAQVALKHRINQLEIDSNFPFAASTRSRFSTKLTKFLEYFVVWIQR